MFRSLEHIYAQVIDDRTGRTLVAASSNEKGAAAKRRQCRRSERDRQSGRRARQRKGHQKVVFDRGGYLYHGRVKALADAAAKQDWSSKRMAATPRLNRIDPRQLNLKEQVVSINRVTKVVKGGKNMSFSALVVVGDPSAKMVGFGTGKAKEVPAAIKKGIEAAKKNLRKINVLETTIQHQVLGRFGADRCC